MIGAYCHRLNLASRRWLAQSFDGALMKNLQVINAVMVRASTLKGRGKLKEYTSFIPSIQNKTRWVGYPNMAIKYHKMHTALQESGLYDSADVEDDEGEDVEVQENGVTKTVKIRPVLLTGSTLDTFKDDMLPAMEKLKMFFKVIQKDDLDLPGARKCFHMAKNHPLLKGHSTEYEERLLPTHRLVVAPNFESGVCKIIEGETEDMTPNEKKACESLLKSNWKALYKKQAPEEQEEAQDEDRHGQYSPSKFFHNPKKRKKISGNVVESRFISNLSWLSPTTVMVERLFSKNRHVLTFARRRMLPRVFEAIIFLKENEHLWDTQLDMMAGLWDNRLKEEYDEEQLYDQEVDEIEAEWVQ
eukprot:scaffold7007_cov146-Amphora_coffeaeformis.AAC.2